MKLAVTGGRVIDPAQRVDRVAGLYVVDGRIVAIGEAPDGFSADRTINAGNRVVCPGLVDLCARLREPGGEHKATIATEARAAAAGGVTTLCCPPDTLPVIDAPPVVELIQQRAAAAGGVRVLVCGALTRGLGEEGLAGMDALRASGCVAVGNALVPIADSALLYRALQYARTCGLQVFLHPDDAYLRGAGRFHEGDICTRAGLEPYPAAAEIVGLARTLLLVEQTGARVHFCRVTTARGVGLVAEARRRGLHVTADTSIHHLTLCDVDLDPFDADGYFIPPVRGREDRDGLREGLAQGTLDCPCSDHQPHNPEAKNTPLSLAEPGATALEVLLPLTLELVREGVLDLQHAIDCLTSKPASILGVPHGTLSPGAVADVCIFDPEARWTLHTATLRSAGKHSPLEGRVLQGRVTHTLQGGELVYEAAS